MVLQYFYGGEQFEIHVRWTNKNEQSIVFQEIIQKLIDQYGASFSGYDDIAQRLDSKVDKLYKLYQLIYIFGDEHHAVPYNPKFRTQFIRGYAALSDEVEAQAHWEATEEGRVVRELFCYILDKLEELTNIYLLDNTYQGKHRYRRKNLEEWAETIDESRMSYEFESVLLQMTDISRMLEHLTEVQRRRLVQHIFLGHTLQEIANQEQVSKQSVEESVAAALKKLRTLL